MGFALIAMAGEAYRSWGVGRPVPFWLDDMLMGSLLIVGATAVRVETAQRRALFSGAWGIAAGMAYLSFFEKLLDPKQQNPGNISLSTLTILAGIGLAVATVCLFLSVALPPREDR